MGVRIGASAGAPPPVRSESETHLWRLASSAAQRTLLTSAGPLGAAGGAAAASCHPAPLWEKHQGQNLTYSLY